MVPIWMNGVMNMKLGRNFKSLMSIVIALVLAALVAAPGRALATQTLEYTPTTNPVADNVTRLDVNKLATDTHEPVVGAKMVILYAETGEPVYDKNGNKVEWISGTEVKEIAQVLNVETEYILREIEAPEGYKKAPDTHFILHSEDFNTRGEIINPHDNVEYAEISGSGPEQAFVLNLYDDVEVRTVDQEKHVQRQVKRKLPQTSDVFDPTIAYAVAACGLAAVATGINLKRRAN